MRFAFYGRVSTEDQQDPTSSRDWQLSRARQLIQPGGGEVVREFFDVGQSRSLPWKRRPQAAALLESLRDPARGFDAVVIGEPARAFSGNQFSLTFPVLVHYGVALWVPEVGGEVDPGSDAHDMLMSLYGGMSKAERRRIQIRVRSAMAAQAENGRRFLGGRPPYGYKLADDGPHPNPGKAANGQRLHRLAVDEVSAPVVRRIFDRYLSGAGLGRIADELTREGIPSPSAYDPKRNPHRAWSSGAWSKMVIRSILSNPRYTGRNVWGKQRRVEVLEDPDDVALGHRQRMRWNDRSEWVFPDERTHEALISDELFARAQLIAAAGMRRVADRGKVSPMRTYMLRGMTRCGLCGRLMVAQHNARGPYYRCRFGDNYSLAGGLDHPKNVYLRESAVVPKLNDWIARTFDPENVEASITKRPGAPATSPAIASARMTIADCDKRLRRLRAAIESGTDPKLVGEWIADVQAERAAAEAVVATAGSSAPRQVSAGELRALLEGIDLAAVLTSADPVDLAALYEKLHVSLTYDVGRSVVVVEADPLAKVSVGGATLTSKHEEDEAPFRGEIRIA